MEQRFVKSAASFLLIILFSLGAAAQVSTPANCALTEAPPLLGLRLGMSPAETQRVFGRDLRVKVKTSGDRVFFQNYINKPTPRSLAGVRALYLRFLDGRLYQIEIFYAEQPAVPTLEAFVQNLTAQLNLPAANWELAKNKAVVDCGRFTIVADRPVDPRVALTDAELSAEAGARRKKND